MTHHLFDDDDLTWVGGVPQRAADPRPRPRWSRPTVARATPASPRTSACCSRCGSLDVAADEQPPVIDAGDFLRDPEAYLRWLCDWLGIDFTDRMLSWPAGPRDSDGVWAPHWYDAVRASTGFEPWRPREVHLDGDGEAVAAACRPAYERLHAARLIL